jgi:hypothetical protein
MGASLRQKSTQAKSVRPGKRPPTHKTRRKATNRSPAEDPDIPDGIREEIESQRRVLVTVTTLLHCLHVVLEHQVDDIGEELSVSAETEVELAYLPDMTAMLLERIHAVHLALDSVSLSRALKAFKR